MYHKAQPEFITSIFLHIATINVHKICAYSQFLITLFLEIIKCPSNFVKQPPLIMTITIIFGNVVHINLQTISNHDPPWINFQIVCLQTIVGNAVLKISRVEGLTAINHHDTNYFWERHPHKSSDMFHIKTWSSITLDKFSNVVHANEFWERRSEKSVVWKDRPPSIIVIQTIFGNTVHINLQTCSISKHDHQSPWINFQILCMQTIFGNAVLKNQSCGRTNLPESTPLSCEQSVRLQIPGELLLTWLTPRQPRQSVLNPHL